MTTLTLLAKGYNASQLSQISDALKLLLEGLEVEAKVIGAAAGRWVQIALAGEDEGIATSYIAKEIGFCPTSFESVKKFSALKGYITNLEKNREELSIDVGVFQPKIVHATIPLSHLQAQLVDGRKVGLRKIGELFGFCEDLPLSLKVVRVNEEESQIEAELSMQQLEKYKVWQEALLDRLLVVGASLHEVKMTLERMKLNRDVISVEPLGVFEHALTCKLGTDAAGLIPKIGRKLPSATFSIFSARVIRGFLTSAAPS
jgi:hypothetical protein